MLIFWIIIFSFLGSAGSIITASIFLRIRKEKQERLIPCLISYATGTLLTAALLGMIAQAISRSNPTLVLSFVLGGLILFFLLEKLVIWRHCHHKQCEVHGSAGPILLIGDSFHNFIDGVVIAASFIISFPIGLIVSVSVIAHEIPQEVGDFAILLDSGYSKRKAFLFNLFSSLTTLPAAIIGYYVLEGISSIIPFILAISAASFIYIALTDLTPGLHNRSTLGASVLQLILILAGIGTIVLILSLRI
ncbi:MAG: ZIP family metal transporter [Promethearchaeota archaeon]|nr:MAG: ZIP family metal transporter [Candidatus Lokiarchaeota archaeon]